MTNTTTKPPAITKTNKPMAQQTAVEWLIEQISEKQPNGFYVIDTLEDVKRVFEQAKQKEREQIIKAHKEGNKHNGWALRHEHEQYYNETYGK